MKTKICRLVLTFTSLCIVFVAGEEITIRTSSVDQSSCVFPDFLTINLLRPGQHTEWSIRLRQDSVLSLVPSVYMMADSESRDMEEHRLVSDEHEGIQGFHNYTYGAAFTAKCVRNSEGRLLLLLKGSVFLDQQKYRITPSSSWQQRALLFPSYTTIVYIMEETSDFKAGSTMMKRPSDVDNEENFDESQAANRYKRDVTTPVTYNIDILTVVDFTLYNRFYNMSNRNATKTASAIVDYLINLFTAVSMRLDTLNLQNRTLKIRLIQPLLLRNSSQAPYTSANLTSDAGTDKINASLLLSLFKKWLTTTTNLPVYDHAMFLTATTIFGGVDSGIKFNVTKGLAYVGALCHGNGDSSSIIEDRGAYQSEGVAAHELAHSLGSLHDGQNNTCSSTQRYIMSDSSYPETSTNIYNPWMFSSCSSETIVKYLKTLEQNQTLLQKCLLNVNGSIQANELHTVSANDQCKIYYGNESFVCRGQGLPSLDKICDEFYCRKPGTTDMCERMEAATGTCCGSQKKCQKGYCIDAAQGECPPLGNCPFGDQPGVILDGKTCAQLPSAYCYSENVYLKCCATCDKIYTSKPGCEYGDKQLGCKASDCGSTFTTGVYAGLPYNSACCSTCPDPRSCMDDVITLQIKEGNTTLAYKCSDYILSRGKRFVCYVKSVLQDVCCKSCEYARNATSPDCPWGDRDDCTNLLSKPPGFNCSQSQWEGCCYTCGLLASNITASTTKTTVKATAKITATKTTVKATAKITATKTTVKATAKITATKTTVKATAKITATKTTVKATAIITATSATKTTVKATSATKTPVTVSSSTHGTTNTNRQVKPQTTCKPSATQTCSACVNVVGVQVLCILLLVYTRLVNWLSN